MAVPRYCRDATHGVSARLNTKGRLAQLRRHVRSVIENWGAGSAGGGCCSSYGCGQGSLMTDPFRGTSTTQWSRRMSVRRAALVLAVLMTGAAAGYVVQHFEGVGAATPRPVQPGGELSATERTTIAIFDRVAPSVVQVAARSRGTDPFSGQGAGAGTGSGFIWDEAGNVVTNNHVLQGADAVAVRLASGEAVRANVVGIAPAYDLAVIRITAAR